MSSAASAAAAPIAEESLPPASLVDALPDHVLLELLPYVGLDNTFFALTCVCTKTKEMCDFEASPVAKEMVTVAKKLFEEGMDQRWGDKGVHENKDEAQKKIEASARLGYRPALGEMKHWGGHGWCFGITYWWLACLSRDSSPWTHACLGFALTEDDRESVDDVQKVLQRAGVALLEGKRFVSSLVSLHTLYSHVLSRERDPDPPTRFFVPLSRPGAADAGNGFAMELMFSRLGYGYPRQRNIDEARAWQYLVRAADEARNGGARYAIHEYYEDGHDRFGVVQDRAKALSYLELGAHENGDLSCISKLKFMGLWNEAADNPIPNEAEENVWEAAEQVEAGWEEEGGEEEEEEEEDEEEEEEEYEKEVEDDSEEDHEDSDEEGEYEEHSFAWTGGESMQVEWDEEE